MTRAADLVPAMNAAEAEFDKACRALNIARSAFGRSRSKVRLDALHAAERDYDMALKAFTRATTAHSKALMSELREFSARATAAQPQQMEMFA